MISPKRVYWDSSTGGFSFFPPAEGYLVCAENGEVPRPLWEPLTEWLAGQDSKQTKIQKQTKSVKPVEDK